MELFLIVLFGVTLAGSAFYAYERGGRDEKHVAIAVVVAATATPLAQSSLFDVTQQGILVLDALLLAFLVYVAITSDRFWPMFAAGFQLTTVLFHMARDYAADIAPAAYANSTIFWSYLVMASLVIGIRTECDVFGERT